MSSPRVWPACGYVRNDTSMKDEVIVAGGFYNEKYLRSVEIYTIDDDTWRAGTHWDHYHVRNLCLDKRAIRL